MSKWGITAIVVLVLIAAAEIVADIPFPGRYKIAYERHPETMESYGYFMLLDTWEGDIYNCDRTACKDRPVN